MKSLSSALLFVLFLMSGLSPVMSVQTEFQLMAPAFTLTDVDGHHFSLNDFKGSAVVLTFIATRSIICRVQVNALVNVSRHFEDEVVFILIGVSNNTITIGGDTDDQLRAFRELCNFTGIAARDINGVTESYNVKYIPTTFIIDYGGYIRHRLAGAMDAREHILLEDLTATIPEFSSTAILLMAIVSGTLTIIIRSRKSSQQHDYNKGKGMRAL